MQELIIGKIGHEPDKMENSSFPQNVTYELDIPPSHAQEQIVMKLKSTLSAGSKPETQLIQRNGDSIDLNLGIVTDVYVPPYLLVTSLPTIEVHVGFDRQVVCYSPFAYLARLVIKDHDLEPYRFYDQDRARIRYKTRFPLSLGFESPLPLISLQYMDVSVIMHYDLGLEARSARGLQWMNIISGNDNQFEEMSPFWNSLPREIGIMIYSFVLQMSQASEKHMENSDLTLDNDYFFLDTKERRVFAQDPHTYFQEEFFEITKTNKPAENDDTVVIPLSRSPEHLPQKLKMIVFFVHEDISFNPVGDLDPIIGASMQYNGRPKPLTDAHFMRVYDPKRKIGKALPVGMYMIPFCVAPKEHKPSGWIHGTRIDRMDLVIKFPKGSPKYNITVCGCRYRTQVVGYGLMSVREPATGQVEEPFAPEIKSEKSTEAFDRKLGI